LKYEIFIEGWFGKMKGGLVFNKGKWGKR